MTKKPNRREVLAGAASVAAAAALPVAAAMDVPGLVESEYLDSPIPFTRLSSKYPEGTWEHEEDIENQIWRSRKARERA